MTTSAPRARATSALRGPPTTPMTRAPAALPSWTAPLPTPPAAAWTSSVSPAASRARRCSPNHPVWYVMKKAAASASSRPSGAGKMPWAFIRASSANAPWGMAGPPMTRSPGANPVTPGPAVRTSPHSSMPGVYGSGGRTW